MPPVVPANRKTNRGFLIALVSSVVLSFTGILIRMVSEDYQLPALILAFWRDILVAACLLPILLIFKPGLIAVNRKDGLFLLAFGAILALFNILWTIAVTITGAAVATVLVYSSAGFTALLGWILLKEKLGWVKVLAIFLCLFGCVLVSGAFDLGQWQINALGIITGILSGVLYAFYSLMGRCASKRELNPWTSLFYTFLFAALILLTINLLPVDFGQTTAVRPGDMFYLGTQWRGWELLFLLAAGPTLLGFGLYNISLGLLPSSTANLILTLEPAFTCVVAFFLLGERLTPIELIGSSIIIVSVVLVRLDKPSPSG